MCGIAAIFAYDSTASPVDPGELRSVRDHMTARGPDGAGEWFDPQRRVGLGHRRLSIIDLSPAGAQPMLWPERRLAVVFNGEIYNYRALRAELEARGHVFKSSGDTEVLLHLYAEHGEAMMNRLRGMFAFVIWDGAKRGMFLARDPFGIKPLYVADDGKTLRAASQVKALLAGGNIAPTPDPAGHAGFFLWGHVPEPFTLYRGIRSLPAGSTLWVGDRGPHPVMKFCSIAEILSQSERSPKPDAAPRLSLGAAEPLAENRLASALRDSVAHHLVADVPVGVFLSSGLDSTTLAALAAEQGGTLRTVTLGFEEFRGTPADETQLAEVVARRYGAQHQTIWVTRRDFQDEAGRLFEAMDQPSTDGVNTYFVSLAAKRAGLKVALSGLGGDELFGGYPAFTQVPRLVSALSLFPFALGASPLARAFRLATQPVLKRFTSPKYAGVLEYGGTYGAAYLLRRALFMPWELPAVLDPELARQGLAELETLPRLAQATAGIASRRARVSSLELKWYMRNQLLRDADWAGMAHSLEIRTPLVDVVLLQSIAPLLVGSAPPGKREMARAPKSPLPSAVLTRPKTGFSIPVSDWLASANPRSATGGPRLERGLRGWAREVYPRFPGASPCDTSERRSPRRQRRIVVFRIGQLGDTIVALPAMRLIKARFPTAHLALLCDRHPGKSYVMASDLLRGAGLFNEFLFYPVGDSADALKPWHLAALLATIRRKRFDTLVYLAPTSRSPRQIQRDRRFFSLAGVREFIGMEGFRELEHKAARKPLEIVPRESELLLDRLAASGLPLSAAECRMDLALRETEAAEVERWLRTLPPSDGRLWLAVAPSSKMPAKRWPLERFEQVVANLIGELEIWPVVFGGPEDREAGESLLRTWKCGHNAAGALSLRGAAAALKQCALYLGNDTGTMHLAAAVGTPCVAIFSSRDRPGLWYPYGGGHRVFRSSIECEGCGLTECLERHNECLNQISVAEVSAACRQMLGSEKSKTEPRQSAKPEPATPWQTAEA